MGVYVVWWGEGLGSTLGSYKEELSGIRTGGMKLEEEMQSRYSWKERVNILLVAAISIQYQSSGIGFLSIENGDTEDFFQFPSLSSQSWEY